MSATLVGCGAPTTESTVAQLAPPQPENSPAASVAETTKPQVQPQPQHQPQPHEVRKHEVHKHEVHKHEVHKEMAPIDETLIPQVFLTADHSALCRVRVGDQLPAITLPQLSGGEAELASLQGGKATVVLFWQEDPWMSAMALKDLSADIGPSEDVAVVGIAVKQEENDIQTTLKEAGAEFPQLLDNDGKAFNQVGMVKLPRVYVLDPTGKIAWFDLEYSSGTRRELKQTLEALAGK